MKGKSEWIRKKEGNKKKRESKRKYEKSQNEKRKKEIRRKKNKVKKDDNLLKMSLKWNSFISCLAELQRRDRGQVFENNCHILLMGWKRSKKRKRQPKWK